MSDAFPAESCFWLITEDLRAASPRGGVGGGRFVPKEFHNAVDAPFAKFAPVSHSVSRDKGFLNATLS